MKSFIDYYAFGWAMPGRNFSAGEYWYGTQGQEMDDELWGTDVAATFKYRVEQSQLGRFFAVDPLADKYPYNSPYAFCENSPIRYVELEGLEKAEPEAFAAAAAVSAERGEGTQRSEYFPKMSRAAFTRQVTKLINDPERANLTEWYCGPTSLMYTFINYKPVDFVNAAFDLYDNGTALIETGGTISVPQNLTGINEGNTHAVFQAMTMALRTSLNNNNDVNAPFPKIQQGTRPWTFVDMANVLGFNIVEGGFGKEEDIPRMNMAMEQGLFTILLENYQVSHGEKFSQFKGQLWSPFDLIGVHYITVTTKITTAKNSNISFDWWDHRSTHPQTEFSTYEGSPETFSEGVKGWWIISSKDK